MIPAKDIHDHRYNRELSLPKEAFMKSPYIHKSQSLLFLLDRSNLLIATILQAPLLQLISARLMSSRYSTYMKASFARDRILYDAS
jgi:hypothetical protein